MKQQPLLLLLLVLLFVAACEQKEAAPIQPPKPYVQATLNGVFYRLQAAGIRNLNIAIDASIYNSCQGGHGYRITDRRDTSIINFSSSITTQQGEGVEIEFVHFLPNEQLRVLPDSLNYVLSSQAQFERLLAIGAYPYREEVVSHYRSGVIIRYRDGQGNIWTSATHPKASGNTFQIVDSAKYPTLSAFNNSLQKVKMNFTCTLYDAKGDSLVLKEGEFLGFYENFSTQK